MEFVEEIFCECLEVYAEYSSVRGSSYMKVIGLIKKEWLGLLDKLDPMRGSVPPSSSSPASLWYFHHRHRPTPPPRPHERGSRPS
jgi:hypothetical protein